MKPGETRFLVEARLWALGVSTSMAAIQPRRNRATWTPIRS